MNHQATAEDEPMPVAFPISSDSESCSTLCSLHATSKNSTSQTKLSPSSANASLIDNVFRQWQAQTQLDYSQTVRVPQDHPTLELAVSYANHVFQRAADHQIPEVIITIQLDTENVHQVHKPLDVRAVGECYRLIIEAQHHHNHHHQEPAEVNFETSTCNLPLLRLMSGNLVLRHLRLEHCSPVDIYVLAYTKSCNAALVIEEPLTQWQKNSLSLHLQDVTITSYSGRGIMNRSLCPVSMKECYVTKSL